MIRRRNSAIAPRPTNAGVPFAPRVIGSLVRPSVPPQEALFTCLPEGLRSLRLHASHMYREALEMATRLRHLSTLQVRAAARVPELGTGEAPLGDHNWAQTTRRGTARVERAAGSQRRGEMRRLSSGSVPAARTRIGEREQDSERDADQDAVGKVGGWVVGPSIPRINPNPDKFKTTPCKPCKRGSR